jgi:hypothetical protein
MNQKMNIKKAFNRNALPSVINGMLHFDTYSDFQTYIANLEALENDSNQVKTAYIQLGVDLTQEFLPNLTDYPVSLRLEQQLTGFTSARKAEETIINNALNSGDDSVFSIVSNPFFKSAMNIDNSVHIGARIFRFFDNGGVIIVLNNNWTAYQTIKTANYETIKSTNDIFVSNDDKSNWSPIYNLDTNGNLTTEKTFTDPGDNIQYHPACALDTTKIVITNLNDGTVRLEYRGTGSGPFTWTFNNVSPIVTYTGNPVIVPCVGTGKVCVQTPIDFWPYICVGCKTFKCNDNCGVKRRREISGDWPNAGGSGKRIRIDATIWVEDGNIGCRSRHFGRNIVGIWVPLNLIYSSSGIFANIVGTFKREVTPGNCIIINQPFNETQHPGGNNASWQNIISQPGINFIDPGNLSSGHRLRLRKGNNPLGTFFGFGVDRPRVILN